jgi:F0F1-type ATP synthase membrane subunit c/vacuolar-type H+-ATPase subunit K
MAGEPTGDLTRDPGWYGVWRSAGILPLLGQPLQLAGRNRGDPLVVMRRVFLSFALVLVGLAGVLLLIQPPGGSGEGDGTDPWVLVVTAVGIGSLVHPLISSRPLDASSDAALASFQPRMFMRIALAEAPALLGFVVALNDPSAFLIYGIGSLFAAAGLLYAAPTRGQLARDQERLAEAGSGRSLVFALRTQPAQLGRW